MNHEKKSLLTKVSNLENFMIEVCKKLKCLPDFNNYLPSQGNLHVISNLNKLLDFKDNITKNRAVNIKIIKKNYPPLNKCEEKVYKSFGNEKLSEGDTCIIGTVWAFILNFIEYDTNETIDDLQVLEEKLKNNCTDCSNHSKENCFQCGACQTFLNFKY